MNKNYVILKKILGIILIILGIVGLFLPFLQGLIFITAGIGLLGNKKLLYKLKRLLAKIRIFFKKKFSG